MAEDVSRNGFDPAKRYLGVRLQQARVWVDADFNEQAAIVHQRLEEAVLDMVGATGAPARAAGFEVETDNELVFDGRHAAASAPSPDLRFADGPFSIELRCSPSYSSEGRVAPGTLLCATDTEGRAHFSLAIDAAGHAVVHRHDQRVLVAPVRWKGPRLLRVVFDGLLMALSADEEHAGHAHVARDVRAERADGIDADGPGTDQSPSVGEHHHHHHHHRRRRPPVRVLVGMALVNGQRRDGFRGSIESITIFAGTDASAPLVARWSLDEGMDTIATDSSGREHHLRLDDGDGSASPRWNNRSLTLSPGRFYVDGLACENRERAPLRAEDAPATDGASIVYLDAWERVVTAAEEPRLRDPALGGVDTAARLRLHHCVRTLPLGADPSVEPESPESHHAWQRLLQRHRSGMLRVQSNTPARLRDGYYRVEIHHSGSRLEGGDTSRSGTRVRAREAEGLHVELCRGERHAWEIGQWCAAEDWVAQIAAVGDDGGTLELSKPLPAALGTSPFWLRPLATFKWSRNNGSDQWSVRHVDGRGVSLIPVPGRRVAVGDLVEISDHRARERGLPGAISSVSRVFDDGVRIELAAALPAHGERLVLTRWHGKALLPVSGSWTPLEHGLVVQFGGAPSHRSGEGWDFATREADASLDWPVCDRRHDTPIAHAADVAQQARAAATPPEPAWQPPRDGRHRLAALALVRRAGAGVSVRDLRRVFAPLGDAGGSPRRRTADDQPSLPAPRVQTIQHVGRDTRIDDGVIHGRQLAPDVGVVPVGAALLSEDARPPRGFAPTGQSLRLPERAPEWCRVLDLPSALRGRVVLLDVAGSLVALVPGGQVWRLGPDTDRWRVIADMPGELHDFGAAVHGEAIHVVGGRLGAGPPLASHRVLERGRWHDRAPLGVARAALRLEVLDGRLLALGGLRSAFFGWRTRDALARRGLSSWWYQEHTTASAEAYDPQTDSWSALPALPAALADAASVVLHGRLHLVGGREVPLLGRPRLRHEHFELASRRARWSRRARPALSRALACAARLGDAVYLVGGEDERGPLADVERYDATRDRWERCAPLPEPVSGAGVVGELGTLVCAGGKRSDAAPASGWACRFESLLFVHRRTAGEAAANDEAVAAPAPARVSMAPVAASNEPAVARSTSAAASSPTATAPAAAPTAADAAPPSSLSGVVAPHPAASPPAQPPRLALPHALAAPELGLRAQLAAVGKKLQKALPVAALAGAAGLLGSGRAPQLIDQGRLELATWLAPPGAIGTSPTAAVPSPAAPAAPAASPASSAGPASSATSAAQPADPLTPPGAQPPAAPPSAAKLDLGDASAAYARGVDVSHYQGQVPWATLAFHGVDYAFTKATQGTRYLDPSFEGNWAAMRAHGLLRGAYHVWEPDQDAVAQAKLFARTIGKESDLPPVIDVELPSRKKKCPELLADIQRFAETVEEELDQVIAIYSYGNYWTTYLTCDGDAKAADIARNLALRPLWIADYDHAKEPKLFGGYLGWDFWQFSDHGSDGQGRLDLDRFSGGEEDLRRWLTRRMRPPVR